MVTFRRNNLILKPQASIGKETMDMILSEGRLVSPGYNMGGHFVCRVLPGRNPDDGYKTFDKCRVGQLQFGMWCQAVPLVRFAFEKKVSFCVQRNADDEDYTGSPYYILHDAIKRYSQMDDCPKYWSDIVRDEYTNKKLLLPSIKHFVLMPVIVYHRGQEDKKITDLNVLDILIMSEKMFHSVGTFLRNNWLQAGDSGGLDLTDPSKGAFLTIWKKDPKIFPPSDVNPGAIIRQGGQMGYDCCLTERFPKIPGTMFYGSSAALTGEQMAWYSQVSRPWESIVNYASYEQQVDWINRYAPAGAVLYAFGDEHDSWITKECKLRADHEPRIGGHMYQGYQAPQTASQPSYQDPTMPVVPSRNPVTNNSVSAYPAELPIESSYSDVPFEDGRNTLGSSSIQDQVLRAASDAMEADAQSMFG